MPKRRFRKIALCLGVLACLTLYLATRGNVRWRIHRHYPTAEVGLRTEGTPHSSLDGLLLRALGLRYFSPFEPVGVRIRDQATPVDFTHFRGMLITYLTLERCVITDIQPLLAMYRPEVSFFSCDFSGLPNDQRGFLHRHPKFDGYTIYTPDDAVPKYPGGYSLSSERFYP